MLRRCEGPTEFAALPVLFKLAFGYPIQSAGIALWNCKGNDGALSCAKSSATDAASVEENGSAQGSPVLPRG
ncbi:TOPRIM nucleotidyl transferase/hydrolase domain-containing protein [Streptomyces sp. NPDC092129]|uniref:TOPRIM nucleotidyl transferase/hydrolase domain-containing protein n=1 Tax=Streptomyces sp. NPDC092129 TaxID=3366010 RepID=UPI00381E0C18